MLPSGYPESAPPEETGKDEYDQKMTHEVLEVQMPVERVFSAREGQINKTEGKDTFKMTEKKRTNPKVMGSGTVAVKRGNGVNRRGSLWTLYP